MYHRHHIVLSDLMKFHTFSKLNIKPVRKYNYVSRPIHGGPVNITLNQEKHVNNDFFYQDEVNSDQMLTLSFGYLIFFNN